MTNGDAQGSQLTGLVALITGAASGIGRATALQCASEGAHVVVLDSDESGAAAVVDEIRAAGGAGSPFAFDLSRSERISSVVSDVIDEQHRIDILVNCAGVRGGFQPLLDTDLEVWEQTFRVNVTAALLLTKHVAAAMIERGQGGTIVNISSDAAFVGGIAPAYSCSKAALHQLSRSVAGEVARYGITVNTVSPGLVDTPGVEMVTDLQAAVQEGGALENPLHRVIQPEEIAEAILFLCRPRGRSITGQVIHVNAGYLI